MTPNAKQHRAVVIEDEHSDAPHGPYRWECLCRRVGHWVATRATAERGAKAHERRYAPKPKANETSEFRKSLRSALSLEF